MIVFSSIDHHLKFGSSSEQNSQGSDVTRQRFASNPDDLHSMPKPKMTTSSSAQTPQHVQHVHTYRWQPQVRVGQLAIKRVIGHRRSFVQQKQQCSEASEAPVRRQYYCYLVELQHPMRTQTWVDPWQFDHQDIRLFADYRRRAGEQAMVNVIETEDLVAKQRSLAGRQPPPSRLLGKRTREAGVVDVLFVDY